jgi:glycosyltransferase involved in cell wall biosynthesis
MAKALQKHVGEVVFLSPDQSLATRLIEFGGRALNHACFAALRHHLSGDHHRFLSKRLSHVFGARLSRSPFDVIFAPNASVEISSLSTDIPIVYSTDLTWADMADYYPGTSPMFAFASKEADRIEAAAIRNSAVLLYPSKWAAKTAIEHYRVAPERVHTIPWGANFDPDDVPSSTAACHHPIGEELVLLWIGVDWERKGGSIAYECLTELLEKGTSARLVICGCTPPNQYTHPKVTVIPFLNKRDPKERKKLSQLFLEATFFIFPTMAEAYGIVLCEASAHGLPSLVRNTGGIGGAVTDGENGCILGPDATGRQYAWKILEIVRDATRYAALVRKSRDAYEERLNWDAWGRSVKPLFEQVVSMRQTKHSLLEPE